MVFMFTALTRDIVGYWIFLVVCSSSFLPSEVSLYYIAVYMSCAIWLCEAGMLPRCPDHCPVVTVLVFVAGN